MMDQAVQHTGRYLRAIRTIAQPGLPVWMVLALLCISPQLAIIPPASAFEIRVRAQSQLTASVVAVGTNLQIHGQLRDDLQQHLPLRQISIHITPSRASASTTRELLTDRRGTFELIEELPPDFYHVSVEFAGSEHLDASVAMHDVQLQALPAGLNLHAPHYIHRPSSPVPLAAHAFIQQTGLARTIVIQKQGADVASIRLDRFGRGSVDVQAALSPGINTLEVLLPATSFRDEVRQSITIRRGDELQIDAQVSNVLERLERGLQVTGYVKDELAAVDNLRLQVTLTKEGDTSEITRTLRSDSSGNFHVFIPNSELSDGTWSAHVDAIPDAGPTLSANAGTALVNAQLTSKILRESAALVVLALLLLAAQRLLRHWQSRRRIREQQRAARTALQGILSDHEIIQVVALNDDFDESHHMTSPDAPSTRTISGIVWDAWQQQTVPHARLTFYATQNQDDDDNSRTILSDANGRFLLDDLATDAYKLSVHAQGFIRTELSFNIPHNGTLARFRLDLTAVPLKIRQIYQATIQTIHGKDLWGQSTPKQIKDIIARTLELDAADNPDLHQRLASSANNPVEILQTLTEVVEESYFSGRQYDEELWTLARELAKALILFAETTNQHTEKP